MTHDWGDENAQEICGGESYEKKVQPSDCSLTAFLLHGLLNDSDLIYGA